MKSAPTIAFDYRPSRRLLALLALVAGLAALAPWLSALAWPACVTTSLLVVAGAAVAARDLRQPRFTRIAHRADGWVLADAQGREHAARLRHWRELGGVLMLEWQSGAGARLRVVLAPDNLDADTRRRLIVLLRSGAATAAAPMR
ncbi:MAG: hypothetical protein DWB45_02460 [Xanthomonadales bacterium]|nr:hypothetical protein [Xanthomonadales bacterium]MDL1868292.1 hypothetical protein [Gammaproteobacteria bacterium PRO6]